MIYLASPYSHPSQAVRKQRYEAALHFCENYILMGQPVFSPIVYGYPMESAIGTDYVSWKGLNDAMLDAASRFWVLTLPGWEESRGVAYEINRWRKRTTTTLLPPLQYVSLTGNLEDYVYDP